VSAREHLLDELARCYARAAVDALLEARDLSSRNEKAPASDELADADAVSQIFGLGRLKKETSDGESTTGHHSPAS
jgi:hypothetical protein